MLGVVINSLKDVKLMSFEELGRALDNQLISEELIPKAVDIYNREARKRSLSRSKAEEKRRHRLL